MLLDSHGGGVGGPGEGEYIQSVEEDHKDWEDGGSSLRSVIPLQSNLCGPPTQLPDSSLDWSGSGVCGKGWAWVFWYEKSLCLLLARSPRDLLLARLIILLGGGSGEMGERQSLGLLFMSSHGLQKTWRGWWGVDCFC